jgi:hypothetical protein
MRCTLEELIKFALNRYNLFEIVTQNRTKYEHVKKEMVAACRTILTDHPYNMYTKSITEASKVKYEGEEYYVMPEDFVTWAEAPNPVIDTVFDGVKTLWKLSTGNAKYRYFVEDSFELYPEFFDAIIALFLYNIAPAYTAINLNQARIETERIKTMRKLREKWNMERFDDIL